MKEFEKEESLFEILSESSIDNKNYKKEILKRQIISLEGQIEDLKKELKLKKQELRDL